ncbi:EF-P 5-aminopentanol modification-associated protein YfmF [Streptococcus porcinus]|uniref:Zinc protease n=2 Tax=Streptococcus porcinus TaxID=1340 RepID=A0A4V0HGX6_STRPO|nr:pitrilysin family protein [Streptococcus porcinus]EGJ26603.1 peptidase M16 inactive domain protein [Streptococcus porcinus str. Jelinkova 176]SQG48808.1 zinc protease [Streptococcus porcinus]VTT47213.1 zinc protease [Streptococcus porcinus]VTT48236.1 zinc protease [Streptococcus porcinus]
MKIVEGVQLHLIKTEKFKTNHITLRFSGDFNQKLVAKRVLVAQMLATANDDYPTAKLFRERLAELYGASLSTEVSVKGKVHIVDIDITFIQDKYSFQGEKLLEEIILLLKGILFSPLLSIAQYQPKVFEVEKTNLMNYIESDKEDSFYYSSLQLKKLFYHNQDLQLSKYGSVELIDRETAYTSYQEFHKMLLEDQIDIYILGEFDEYKVVQLFHQFPFEGRQKELSYYYHQEYANIVSEKIEKKFLNQSILDLAYYFPVDPFKEDYYALLVLNGLLGSYTHSLLFTKVREKEGIAYSIGSSLDRHTGLLEIFAGINKEDKARALQLIVKEMNDIKMGRFSSHLVEKTKVMLQTNGKQSEDYCKALIDSSYIRSYVTPEFSLEKWLTGIRAVKKMDIIKAANKLKLQAVYFLEGNK